MLLTTIILQKTYHSQMSITCINDPTVSKTRNHNLFFEFGLSLVSSSVWAVVLKRGDEGTWNISEYSIASQNDVMPEVPETKEVYKKKVFEFLHTSFASFRAYPNCWFSISGVRGGGQVSY